MKEISNDIPPIDKIEEILCSIQTLPSSSGGTMQQREEVLNALEIMTEWLDGDLSDIEEKKQSARQFKGSLLNLSCPLRMLFFIKRHMSDFNLVYLASHLAAKCLLWDSTSDDGEMQELILSSSLILCRQNCFWDLQLAIEEAPVQKQEVHWNAISSIWSFIRNIVFDGPSYLTNKQLSSLMECDIRFLEYPCIDSSIENALSVVGDVARVVGEVIKTSIEQELTVNGQYRNLLQVIMAFCQMHESDWLASLQHVRDVLFCCSICVKRMSEDDALAWAPLVGKGLSTYVSDKVEVEPFGGDFVAALIKKVARDRLVTTSLGTSLFAIIQSTKVTAEVKKKYSKIIRQIVAV